MSSPARGRILDAAFEAFMRFGYEGASTAEIARIARVSKRDLYANFAGKHAMLAACITARAERMRQPLGLPVPQTVAALRDTLIQYGTTLLRELSRPEVLATYRLAILNAETAPEVARTLDRFGPAESAARLAALLRDVQGNGLLSSAEPEAMAEIFQSILVGDGFLTRQLMKVAEPPGEADVRRRAEQAVDCLERLYGGAAVEKRAAAIAPGSAPA